MTNTTIETTGWPYDASWHTPAQRVRMQELRDDIARARRNNADGYPFHIWLDGRLHDSAVTFTDAFDECRAQRKAGFHGPIVIGSGNTDRTMMHMGDAVVRVELPA